jgi:plasmid stabilization system protein ParE
MAYRVSLAAPAEEDAYAAFERIRAAAPLHAASWLAQLFEAGTYRIIFHVQKDEQHVRILRIWHGSRNALTADDVKE